MKFRKFAFNIPTKNKLTVFALPQSNHYQGIKDIKFTPSIKVKKVNSNTKIAIWEKTDSVTLSFRHAPIVIDKKLSNVKIAQKSDKNLFNSDQFINYEDKYMKKLAKTWLNKSSAKSPNDILEVMYQNTLNYLTYGNPIQGLYTFKDAYNQRVTDCGGFATFLTTLLQTQGIVCRLVSGFIYKKGLLRKAKEMFGSPKSLTDISMHAWLEVIQEDGDWFPLDPSVEWRRLNRQSTRTGGMGKTGADRLVVGFGHNFLIKINNRVITFPLLQNPVNI